MRKLNKNIIIYSMAFLLPFNSICSGYIPLAANEVVPDLIEDNLCYEDLEEYEPLFRSFEEQIEEEEAVLPAGFISKWSKKVKKWFKKRVYLFCKKCLKIKRVKNAEDAAHYIAKFRRKLSRYCTPQQVETIVSRFNQTPPQYCDMNAFAAFEKRIVFYDENPSKYPDEGDRNRYDLSCKTQAEQRKEIEDIPVKSLVGGVEFFCGALISVLPWPGCKWLGNFLMGLGASHVTDGYVEQAKEERKK